MTGSAGPSEPKQEISEYELAWAAENLPEIRRWVSGRLFLYKALVTGLVLGLAAHISGYLLAVSVVGEPAGLIADLLRNVGIGAVDRWRPGVLRPALARDAAPVSRSHAPAI